NPNQKFKFFYTILLTGGVEKKNRLKPPLLFENPSNLTRRLWIQSQPYSYGDFRSLKILIPLVCLKLNIIFYRLHYDPGFVCDFAVRRRLCQRLLEEFHRRLILLPRQCHVAEQSIYVSKFRALT